MDIRKSKKIDEKYSNGEKYFETAIKKKGKGGIMPFVIDTYGESIKKLKLWPAAC